jgi:hypothetical protein
MGFSKVVAKTGAWSVPMFGKCEEAGKEAKSMKIKEYYRNVFKSHASEYFSSFRRC